MHSFGKAYTRLISCHLSTSKGDMLEQEAPSQVESPKKDYQSEIWLLLSDKKPFPRNFITQTQKTSREVPQKLFRVFDQPSQP